MACTIARVRPRLTDAQTHHPVQVVPVHFDGLTRDDLDAVVRNVLPASHQQPARSMTSCPQIPNIWEEKTR